MVMVSKVFLMELKLYRDSLCLPQGRQWSILSFTGWCFHRFNQNFVAVTAQAYGPQTISVVGVNSCAFLEPTEPSNSSARSYCSHVLAFLNTYGSYVPTTVSSINSGFLCPHM
ncbi:hypothetical protein PVK06_028380 [Gossypium arboreum]|uniref:Uncharacterized protein n=1 Tax=Gossypium arboreum TaxID=29729 RepID=A0ABR0P4G6_GOSAR|nr:hypothetical protein PVK06_028380 [Gossypium arboreum]